MGKHNLVDKPLLVRFYLPTSYKAKMDFILWSEVEKRVPHGAYTEFLSSIVKKTLDLTSQEQLRAVYSAEVSAKEVLSAATGEAKGRD